MVYALKATISPVHTSAQVEDLLMFTISYYMNVLAFVLLTPHITKIIINNTENETQYDNIIQKNCFRIYPHYVYPLRHGTI